MLRNHLWVIVLCVTIVPSWAFGKAPKEEKSPTSRSTSKQSDVRVVPRRIVRVRQMPKRVVPVVRGVPLRAATIRKPLVRRSVPLIQKRVLPAIVPRKRALVASIAPKKPLLPMWAWIAIGAGSAVVVTTVIVAAAVASAEVDQVEPIVNVGGTP